MMRPMLWLRSRIGVELDPFLGPDWRELFQRSPIIVYDIGASGGLFSPYRQEASEELRFCGFEPHGDEFRKLTEKYQGRDNIELRPAALCDTDGQVTFYHCNGAPTISSLYDRDGFGKGSEAVEVEGVRLDSVPQRFAFPAADIVKLDTEGNEHTILRSGPKMLADNILGVWTEISFWRMPGEQGALFHEIDQLLKEAGFVLYDLQINRSQFSGVGGKKGKPRSGDALYLRDFTDFYRANHDRIDETNMRIKLLKLLSLCVATGYLDYAIEILEFGRCQGLIEGFEAYPLMKRFAATTDISNLLPNFPGRLKLALVFDMLSSILHKNAKKGIPPSFNMIGNHWPFIVRRRRPPSTALLNNATFGGNAAGDKTVKLTESDLDAS